MDTVLILVVLYGGISLLCIRLFSRLVTGFVVAELLALMLGAGIVFLYAEAGHGPSATQTMFIVLLGTMVTATVYAVNYLRARLSR